MNVLSTNVGKKEIIKYRGKNVSTGIFKLPTKQGIFLEKEDVKTDEVVDRRYHGGIDKACYIYGYQHYKFWSEAHPDLSLSHGFFGENITLDIFDETIVQIGSIYQLGDGVVQISQPRQPCFKLGVRFESQKVVKQMVNSGFCGSYVRVIENGLVRPGDKMTPLEIKTNQPTIKHTFFSSA